MLVDIRSGLFGDVDTAEAVAQGQLSEELIVGQRSRRLLGRIVEEILVGDRSLGTGAVDVAWQIGPQGELGE